MSTKYSLPMALPFLSNAKAALAVMVLLMSYSAAAVASDDVGGASMLYACDFRGEDGPVTVEFRTYREHFSEYQQGNEVLEATWLRHRSVIQLFDSFEHPQRWLLSLDTETMEALAVVDGQLKNATDCWSGAQAANHSGTTLTLP